MTEQFLTSTIVLAEGKTAHLESALSFFSHQPHLSHLVTGSPDLTICNQELTTVTIEMVRAIIQELSFARYSGQVRGVVILAADGASLPAQNSLLKVLEEPPAHTQLVLTVNYLNSLLPTVRSRCRVWAGRGSDQKSEPDPAVVEIAQRLGSLSLSGAIELAEKYQDRAEAVTLIESLTEYCHRQNQIQPTTQLVNRLQHLNQAHQDLKANCNVRLVLENCLFKMRSYQG